ALFSISGLLMIRAQPGLARVPVAGDAGLDDVRRAPASQLATDGIRWRVAARAPIYSTPVIAGDLLLIGSDDESLYAIRTSDGQVHWRFVTAGPIRAAPTV